MDLDRRQMLGVLAASAAMGATVATTTAAQAAPMPSLPLTALTKDRRHACAYHCDFGDPARYAQMLQNMHYHLEAYDFDPMGTDLKLVMVVHAAGIKFHLKTLEGTPWAKETLSPELDQRLEALSRAGVEVYLCETSLRIRNLTADHARPASYMKLVPSGVATVAALQSLGYAYMKIG